MLLLVNDSPYFDLVIRSLSEVLVKLQIPHQVVHETKQTEDLYLLCTVHEGKDLPNHYIAYNWEQLTTRKVWPESLFERLRNAHAVWDYSWSNVQILKTKGIDAIHVPFGYSPCMEFCHQSTKDIDIVFLGAMNESRRQKLHHLLLGYRNKPNKLFISNSCWGEQIARVYERSRIGINLHFYDGKTILEVLRILPMLANGLFVISEHGDDPWYSTHFEPVLTWVDSPLELYRKCIELLILPEEQKNLRLAQQKEYILRHCNYISFVDRPEVLASIQMKL